MGIAISLKDYLDEHGIEYNLVLHDPTKCSSRTAQASHVSGHDLAKGVVVKGKKSYLIAIVPASKRLRMRKMERWLKQPVCLATEDEIQKFLASPGGWLILNLHGLDNEGWGPVSTEYLDNLLSRMVKIDYLDVLPTGEVFKKV